MRKWLSKLDFTLTFRLILSIAMIYTGYLQNDRISFLVGLLLGVYAIIANKYKVGCGYDGCGYTPRYDAKKDATKINHPIDYSEVK